MQDFKDSDKIRGTMGAN